MNIRMIAFAIPLTLVWGGSLAQQSTTQPPSETGESAENVAQAILIKHAIEILEKNAKAAGRESGEIDKLIRALAGVSVRDIRQYGICGGPNSEVRRIIGSLCK